MVVLKMGRCRGNCAQVGYQSSNKSPSFVGGSIDALEVHWWCTGGTQGCAVLGGRADSPYTFPSGGFLAVR